MGPINVPRSVPTVHPDSGWSTPDSNWMKDLDRFRYENSPLSKLTDEQRYPGPTKEGELGYPEYPDVVTAEERKAGQPVYNYSRYDINWHREYGLHGNNGTTGYDIAPTPGDKEYASDLHSNVRQESFGNQREPNTGPNFWPTPAHWYER